jgi:tetratricopeptide (TPR) repeat protein
MGDLTIGLLGALLATNQPVAMSNLVAQQTGVALPIVDKQDPTERELHTVMAGDDAAMDEVNAWINTNQIPSGDTNAVAQFNQKIRDRLDVVKHDYDVFLRNHPDSARGYLAYGTFLNDIGDEEAAHVQYLNAKQLDPKNPAVWNQLANYYGEFGELTNAFIAYTEAIRLDPAEPVYYQNFATTVYLYRKDAREYYHITEQQVFDKALDLYKQAIKQAPEDLVIATDYAESYYGIKPMRTNDALLAWTNALKICKDENEREGVELHLARVKTFAGFYDDAQGQLDLVTNDAFHDMKVRLTRSLADHRNPPTNSVADTDINSAAAITNSVNIDNSPLPPDLQPNRPKLTSAFTNTAEITTNLIQMPAPAHGK